MSMADYRLAYFENLEKRLSDKKDFLKAYKKNVQSLKSTGNCMFGLSFLCCCCCSVCGQTSLILADFANHWLDALKIYEGMDPQEVKKIFKNALRVLRLHKDEVEQTDKKNKDEVQEAITTKDQKTYQDLKFKALMYHTTNVMDDQWMYKLFTSLYKPHSQVEKEEPEKLMNSPAGTMLYIAMPLFYSALVKDIKHAYRFDEQVAYHLTTMLGTYKKQ